MVDPRVVAEVVEAGAMDHYARLLRNLLDVPTALVSIVQAEQQVFPGVLGLPEPYLSARSTPLSLSLCQYVVRDAAPLIISDARLDERVSTHPALDGLGIVAYAGWPVRAGGEEVIGSLCAIDDVPHDWSTQELAVLRELADACSVDLQQRLTARAETEALTRLIFESLSLAIVFYDPDGQLVVANRGAHWGAAAAGFRLDEAPYAGPHVRRADNRTPVPYDAQLIPRALRGEPPEHEMQWVGEPGSEFAVMSETRRVVDDSGKLLGTLVSSHDVTDLARALDVRDNFVSTVSHELRTPLAAIIGYTEVLAEELVEQDFVVQQALEVITRRSSDLQSRIADLLDITDLRRRLQLRTADVTALTQRCVEAMATTAAVAGVTVVLEASSTERAIVDAGRVEQALENLVSNAVKFSASGGAVRVQVSGDAERVRLTVSDEGIGMTPAEVALAQTRFWRAERSHREAVAGIGLGLSLVHDIVQAHHGTTTIESTPGTGTTVTLALPRSAAGGRS